MGNTSKSLALILILAITISSLSMLMIKPANAQTIPKPSVPEFTVKLMDTSYDVSPTSTINPYTGATTAVEGKHIESRAIEIRIKNEPFTSFEVQQGTAKWTVGYYYQIQWKGHFENDWHQMFLISDGLLSKDSGPETVFASEGTYSETEGLSMQRQGMYTTFPPNSQIDFQVKAMIGYIHREVTAIPGGGWLLTGEESNWSSTQTLNLADGSVPVSTSTAPNPTPTLSVPEFSWLTILPTLLAAPIVLIIVRKRLQGNVC